MKKFTKSGKKALFSISFQMKNDKILTMIVNQDTKNSTFKMIIFFVPTKYSLIGCHSPSLFKNLVKSLETITMNHVKDAHQINYVATL